jgi:transcriptional regulator with XRE-family HTH domain
VLQAHNVAVPSETLSDGEAIARRRKRLGWKQGLLADKAGVGITTVVQIEKDRSVTTEKLRAVLSALDKAEKKAAGPNLATPSGTTEPSMKEGADVPASARLADIRKRLANIQTALTALAHQLGLVSAELDHEASGAGDQKRKQG